MLADAIEDLKVELTERGFRPDLVVAVAEDWGIRPELLERKFREATGRRPDEWRIVDTGAAEAARACKLAEQWHLEEFWIRDIQLDLFDGDRAYVLRKRFTWDHESYVAVHAFRDALYCLRVRDCRRIRISFPTAATLRDWAARNLTSAQESPA